MKIGLLNIRSIRNKMEHINEILQESKLDILCLTETWLHDCDIGAVRSALCEKHTILSVPRPDADRRGGGVAVICALALSNVTRVNVDPTPSAFEILEVLINLHQQTLRVATIYRPGLSGSDRDFMEEFDQFLETFALKRGEILVCGDFNYWIDNPLQKPFSSEFVELIDSNNFVNHVLHPTHRSSAFQTCWLM